MLRVGGDGEQSLGSNVEQQAIDHGLVLVGELGDRRREREDHNVVLDGKQIGLTRLEPAPGGTRLALRAVSIAARIVGDLDLLAALAAQDMSTERGATALLDSRHHLELTPAQVSVLSLPPRRPVDAEDLRDLQSRTLHQRRPTRAAWFPEERRLRAGSRWPPAHTGPWSPASCARAGPGSRGYRPSAPAGAWRNSGAAYA